MDPETIALIFNRIIGYSGRFFHVEGDEIVETGDWLGQGIAEKRYTLDEAERWLAVELYSQHVIRKIDLQAIQDQLKRLDSYMGQLGPVGWALFSGPHPGG